PSGAQGASQRKLPKSAASSNSSANWQRLRRRTASSASSWSCREKRTRFLGSRCRESRRTTRLPSRARPKARRGGPGEARVRRGGDQASHVLPSYQAAPRAADRGTTEEVALSQTAQRRAEGGTAVCDELRGIHRPATA